MPPFLGALALNHTSRFFREETLETFRSSFKAHFHATRTRCQDLQAREKDIGEKLRKGGGQALDDSGSVGETSLDALLSLSAVLLLFTRATFCVLQMRFGSQRVDLLARESVHKGGKGIEQPTE
jgi:hypothetical protein